MNEIQEVTAQAGWHCLSYMPCISQHGCVQDVPFFEWNALDTDNAKRAYLEAAIALELQNGSNHKAAVLHNRKLSSHASVLAA